MLIALFPGDGIGPEIVAEAKRVLDALVIDGLTYEDGLVGGAAYKAVGHPLPPFLIEGGMGDWGQILDGLRLTGFFLERSVLTDRRADVLAARERLVERLKRAVA